MLRGIRGKTTLQIFSCLHHYLSVTVKNALKYTKIAPKLLDIQIKHVIIDEYTGDLHAN